MTTENDSEKPIEPPYRFYEFIEIPKSTWKWDVLGNGTIVIEGIKTKPSWLTRFKTAFVLGSKWTEIQNKEAQP